MSENARMDTALNSTKTSSDEETLFGGSHVAKDGLDDFLNEVSETVEAAAPRLTISRPEDFDDADIEDSILEEVRSQTVATEDAGSVYTETTSSATEDHDNWPWDTDLDEIKSRNSEQTAAQDDYDDLGFDELDRLTRPSTAGREASALPVLEDDHSAIEDVVLSMPIVQTPVEATLAGLTRSTGLSAVEAVSAEIEREPGQKEHALQQEASTPEIESPEMDVSAHRVALPKRIGDGRLVPARLTWRPGDPFGGTDGTGRRRFRWDVMLTSAGITAACGMACIWLLRTILA